MSTATVANGINMGVSSPSGGIESRDKPDWSRLGAAPFRVVRDIRDEQLAEQANVILGLCDSCGGATDQTWLVCDAGNRHFGACRECIEARGSRVLLRQIRNCEHIREETRRELDRLAELRRRQC
jgi:hypothetical protein